MDYYNHNPCGRAIVFSVNLCTSVQPNGQVAIHQGGGPGETDARPWPPLRRVRLSSPHSLPLRSGVRIPTNQPKPKLSARPTPPLRWPRLRRSRSGSSSSTASGARRRSVAASPSSTPPTRPTSVSALDRSTSPAFVPPLSFATRRPS
jgi:hypothetical protein